MDISEWALLVSGVAVGIGIFGEIKSGQFSPWEKVFEYIVLYGIVVELLADGGVFLFSNQLQIISDKEIAELNARALTAEVELARFKAPPYSVPVVHGVAIPDLRRGFTQRIVLTTDTHVESPMLTEKDATVTWTLFLDQDSVGSHLYGLDFMPELKPVKYLGPHLREGVPAVVEGQ